MPAQLTTDLAVDFLEPSFLPLQVCLLVSPTLPDHLSSRFDHPPRPRIDFDLCWALTRSWPAQAYQVLSTHGSIKIPLCLILDKAELTSHCPPFHPPPTVSLSDRTRSFQIAISRCPPQPAAPLFALASESQSSVTLICHTRHLLSIDLSTPVLSVRDLSFPHGLPNPTPLLSKLPAHAYLKCPKQHEALKLEA